MTDIETINAEYNLFTKLPEATWVDGPWGVAKGDNEEITVHLDSLSGAYVSLSMEEAAFGGLDVEYSGRSYLGRMYRPIQDNTKEAKK